MKYQDFKNSKQPMQNFVLKT